MSAALAVVVSGCAARSAPIPAPPVPSPTPVAPTPVEPAPLEPAPSDAAVPLRTQVGLASYYGRGFHGRTTASGVPFDMRQPVAAHPSFPFGTRVRITCLESQQQVVVTIIDRGPARRQQRAGVIIDVSQGVAERLGFTRDGLRRVRVEVIEWGQDESS